MIATRWNTRLSFLLFISTYSLHVILVTIHAWRCVLAVVPATRVEAAQCIIDDQQTRAELRCLTLTSPHAGGRLEDRRLPNGFWRLNSFQNRRCGNVGGQAKHPMKSRHRSPALADQPIMSRMTASPVANSPSSPG